MKNLLQTFVGALIFGLLVYFLFVVYDKNKDRIGWGETNKKLSEEAEKVSENVDKGVRKAKKIYDKVRKEVSEDDGNGTPPSPDGVSGADNNAPNPPATNTNTWGNTTPAPPEGTLIPETVITPTNTPPPTRTSAPDPNDTTPYDIQLALVKNNAYNPKTWQSLSDLGTLSALTAPDNRKRVILGTYYGRARANEVLDIIKQRGFTDAFLLAGGKANAVNLPQINFNKRRLTSNSYIVQLAAMRNPQSKKFKDLNKSGNIYFEYAADLDITKILIGPYQNETEAAQALQEIKAKGYPRAFTRRLTIHEVANMEQVVY